MSRRKSAKELDDMADAIWARHANPDYYSSSRGSASPIRDIGEDAVGLSELTRRACASLRFLYARDKTFTPNKKYFHHDL